MKKFRILLTAIAISLLSITAVTADSETKATNHSKDLFPFQNTQKPSSLIIDKSESATRGSCTAFISNGGTYCYIVNDLTFMCVYECITFPQ